MESILKRSLTHTQPLLRNSSDFGIICEAISGNYPGGIGAPNLLVKTPNLNRTLKKFEEEIGRSQNIHEHHI